MLHPTGFGQQGESAMLAAAEGGAGGAASGLTGQAAQRAAASRNAGGYQAALDDVARNRMKASAGASEGIAAQNANLEQEQRQEGARGLQGLYGTDESGMLNAMNQEHSDVNSEIEGNKTGWLQNALAVMATINGSGNAAANMFKSGMFGGGSGGN